MKKKLLARIAAWLAAVSMIASPAGINIAEVAVMAVEETSVTDVAENSDDSEIQPSETTDTSVTETPSETEVPAETTVPTDVSDDETTETAVPEETTVPVTEIPADETDTSEEETTDDTSEVAEEVSEEEAEEAAEPEIYHYISPYIGEGLMQYEYYHEDYGDDEVSDDSISCVTAPSYYSAQSEYSSLDGYNALSTSLKKVYNSCYEAAVKIDTSAEYDAVLHSSYDNYYFEPIEVADYDVGADLFKVFVAIRADNPQFFWMGHGYYSSGGSGSTSIAFGIDDAAIDYIDGDYRMTVKNQIMTEVEQVLSEAAMYGNEYTQEWYIHNYLCEATDYVSGAAHAHDISGLLVDGKAVCESYAKCFQMFMNALDIQVLYVTGIGNGGGHAWNQIGLDNGGTTEWYNVDVTWDDNDNDYDYHYFNVVDSDGSSYDFTYGPYGDGTVNAHTPEQPSSDDYLYSVNTCNSTTYSYDNHEENYMESGDGIARIGGRVYATLDAAIGAVKADDATITLLADAEYSGKTMPEYDFTINGAGFAITFNSNMVLNSDVTIKGVKGVEQNALLPVYTIETGEHTLTFGDGMVNYVPVVINGSETGSLTFEASESEYLLASVIDFKNITVPDNTAVKLLYSTYGTNLTLGENSEFNVVSGSIDFVNYTAKATSKIVLGATGENAGIHFGGKINAPIVNIYASSIDYASDYAIVYTDNDFSVDMFNIVNTGVEPNVICGIQKVYNGEGLRYYYAVATADYTITDGTKTVRRVTLEEAIAYIDEAAKSTAKYTVTYTGEEDTIVLSGSVFNTAKAKEIIFEGAGFNITGDITLKTNLTFLNGAAFHGDIATGSFVLKLCGSESYYFILGEVLSAQNITVDNTSLSFVNNEATVVVKNLVLENETYINSNIKALNIANLTMSDNAFFASVGEGNVTIGNLKSTGSNSMVSYEVPIEITGKVTTDGTPITVFASTVIGVDDEGKEKRENIAENGQTALVVANTSVKATTFTTSAKTESGDNLSLIRVDNELRFASASIIVEDLGSYTLWEDALAAINAAGSADKEFTVTLLDDVTVNNLVLPAAAKAAGITFVGSGKTLTVNNTAISAKGNLAFENITLESSKPFTLTASKNLSLTGFTSASMKTLKGGSKFALEWGTDNNLCVPLSGFGTVTIKENASMTTAATASFTKLVMEANSKLVVPSASKVTIKDIEGVAASAIYYEEGFTPVSVTGNANGTITFTGESKFTDGQHLFTSKTANLACFKIAEASCPDELYEYTVSRTGNNVYLRSVKLYLSPDGENVYKMATWADVVSSINAANNKNAQYVIKLLGDYDIGGAMTMPKKGTYAALSIMADTETDLTFVGNSITLTGDTMFTNVALSALKKSGTSYNPVAYKINAGAYMLYLYNVTGSEITNITSKSSVLFDNTDIAGSVSAANLLINSSTINDKVTVTGNLNVGPDAVVLGDLTADKITVPDSETSRLTLTYGKKFTIGKTGFASEDKLTVAFKEPGKESNVVFDNGMEVAAITGNYYGNIVLQGQEDLSVIRSGNKLIAGQTNMLYILEDDAGNTTLYANLKDIMSEITRIGNANGNYTIYLSENEEITGARPLPTAKKYHSITFKPSEGDVTLYLTGDIKLTGNIWFSAGVNVVKKNAKTGALLPININAGAYYFTTYNYINAGNVNGAKGGAAFWSGADISGKINVAELNVGGTIVLGEKASLTAAKIYSSDETVLEYQYKNASKIKVGTFIGGQSLGVRLMDGELIYEFPDGNFDVMNITGDYDIDMVMLYGEDDYYSDYSVVRSGNKLIAGIADDMYILWAYENEDDEEGKPSLYASLKDMMTEINRINNPEGYYTVCLAHDETIKGALPLPAAKKYGTIEFNSLESAGNVTVNLTGDIKSTGNLVISPYVQLKKINAKTNAELPINVNIGTYDFAVYSAINVGKVTGKGIAVFADYVNVTGSINVQYIGFNNKIVLEDKASLTATFVVTSGENSEIIYPYKNASKIKLGAIYGDPFTITLLDENGNPVTLTEDYAGKVLMAKCGDASLITIGNTMPEGYYPVLTSKGALTIGIIIEELSSANEAIVSEEYAEKIAEIEKMSSLFPAA